LDNTTGTLTIKGNGLMVTPCDVNMSFVKTLVIEDGIKSIAPEAFANYKIDDVRIGASVIDIGEGAFRDVFFRAFPMVLIIPDSVVTIGKEAFYGSNVDAVDLGSSVETIGDRAFSTLFLKQLSISKSVTSIGVGAFYFATDLTLIEVDKDNKYFECVDGVLFDKERTTLIQYPLGWGKEEYEIPNTVKTISYGAFAASNLKSVVIPDSVITVDNYSFFQSHLESIVIPDSVTSIGEGAFSVRNGIESVTIGKSVVSIGPSAFSSLAFSSVVIPASVKYIGEYAFSFSDSLKTVAFLGTDNPGRPGVYDVFSNCRSLAYVCVPDNYSSDEFCGVHDLSALAKCGISKN